jgi:hypothetical protein
MKNLRLFVSCLGSNIFNLDSTVKPNLGAILFNCDNASRFHTIKRDALSQLNSIAPKLGLTVESRLKILEPKQCITFNGVILI